MEVEPDLTSGAFLCCVQRFTARRGIPRLITSDNATTFKAASGILLKIAKSPEVLAYLASKRITWRFLSEKAPWQGGAFEILIKLVKRTLKKILGQALLTLFDTAWTDGILYKLFSELGIGGRIWKVIKDLYTNVKAKVLYAGSLSRKIDVSQGKVPIYVQSICQ